MKHFLLTWLATAAAIWVTGHIVKGFIVTSFLAAIIAAVAIALVNTFVRPILSLISLPITFLTLGLFTWVINALTLWLASAFTAQYGFRIVGFIPALLGAIVLAIVSSIINYFVRVID